VLEAPVIIEGKLQMLRGFHTTCIIEEGDELLWDYTYHKIKDLTHCICGKTRESCEVFNWQNDHDHMIEGMISKIYL
jgi:hypothetical protein